MSAKANLSKLNAELASRLTDALSTPPEKSEGWLIRPNTSNLPITYAPISQHQVTLRTSGGLTSDDYWKVIGAAVSDCGVLVELIIERFDPVTRKRATPFAAARITSHFESWTIALRPPYMFADCYTVDEAMRWAVTNLVNRSLVEAELAAVKNAREEAERIAAEHSDLGYGTW